MYLYILAADSGDARAHLPHYHGAHPKKITETPSKARRASAISYSTGILLFWELTWRPSVPLNLTLMVLNRGVSGVPLHLG